MPAVFITGASRGIGRATALLFARHGYLTAVNYNSSEKESLELVRNIKESGGFAVAIRGDVSDFDRCRDMIKEAEAQLGPVDVLINNAGIACDRLFTDTSPEEWSRVFAVNVNGAYNCCRAVLSGMISRKRGSIVNLSSMWGITGGSCEVAYSASKAAVIGFTKALAKELGPSGIRVNCVAPGVITTDMNARLSEDDLAALAEETPLCRIGTPEEAAEAIYYLASDKARFITGAVLSVNGGIVI